MPKSINLTGTSGKTYNLDEIAQDTRSSSGELLVQIWKWNPNLPRNNPHSNPNPPSPKIGQIWLSRLVITGSEEYYEIENASE